MRIVLIIALMLSLTTVAFAETYTGQAKDITKTNRGVTFIVEVKNSSGDVVFATSQNVNTGIMTGEQAEQMIKDIVLKFTQEIYAHIEEGKKVIANKVNIEKYKASVDSFVEKEDRPLIVPKLITP